MANMALRGRLSTEQSALLRRGIARTGLFVASFVGLVAAATQLG